MLAPTLTFNQPMHANMTRLSALHVASAACCQRCMVAARRACAAGLSRAATMVHCGSPNCMGAQPHVVEGTYGGAGSRGTCLPRWPGAAPAGLPLICIPRCNRNPRKHTPPRASGWNAASVRTARGRQAGGGLWGLRES